LTPAESVGLGGGTSEGEPGAGVASVPEASATIEAYPGAAAENNDVAIAVAGIPDDATSTAEAASSQAEAVAATAESASPDEYADKTADRYQAAWRSVRLGIYVLAGILAILLAGLLWTGHRRKA
jgi:hypothetical protein